MSRRILIVAAHPDDEVLGCGGTMARLSREGCEVFTLILGEGITSRDENRNPGKRESELAELKRQIARANEILGVKEVFSLDFPDNRFDTIPLLEIVKAIETVKNEVKPVTIFTHFDKDLNIDHGITQRAVLTAARPQSGESVREILSFEVLSSTEWNSPISFSPDVFYDITQTLEIKLAAMTEYRDEIRVFPHPRTLEGIEINARYWGMTIGNGVSEAFECVRMIR